MFLLHLKGSVTTVLIVPHIAQTTARTVYCKGNKSSPRLLLHLRKSSQLSQVPLGIPLEHVTKSKGKYQHQKASLAAPKECGRTKMFISACNFSLRR